MVFHQLLDQVLGQRSKVTLLRLLVRVRGEHTGRDLARMVALDHKTCHAALRSLAANGIVTMRRMGIGLAYALNVGHPVVGEILIPAFEAEAALVERYVREVRLLLRDSVESIVLFGSVARTEEHPASDVDLLVVTADPRTRESVKRRLDEVTASLAARWGSVPQILVVDRPRLQREVARGHKLYLEILRTGRVVHGKRLAALTRHVA